MVASSVSSENCSRASHGNLPLPFTLKLPEAYFELKKDFVQRESLNTLDTRHQFELLHNFHVRK
jgi:hypothetical protein